MTGPDDSHAVVLDLIAAQPVLATDHGVGGQLRRLCSAAADALSAVGAGVSVQQQQGARGITVGSDPISTKLEDLQFLLGEGPCADAVAARRPVLVPDLDGAAMQRWPGYAPAMRDHGIRAVFAFPLQAGGARLGAMDVFRTEPGLLTPPQTRLALWFADIAVAVLLDGQDNAAADSVGELEDQFIHHAELFQAQGMLTVQLNVSITEAMARIRAYTFAHDRLLHDVAADIVHGRLRMDR